MLNNYNLKNYTAAEMIVNQYNRMIRINLYKNGKAMVCAVYGNSKLNELDIMLLAEFGESTCTSDGEITIYTYFRNEI